MYTLQQLKYVCICEETWEEIKLAHKTLAYKIMLHNMFLNLEMQNKNITMMMPDSY